MKIFHKKIKYRITLMIILAMLLQIVAPKVLNYTFADGGEPGLEEQVDQENPDESIAPEESTVPEESEDQEDEVIPEEENSEEQEENEAIDETQIEDSENDLEITDKEGSEGNSGKFPYIVNVEIKDQDGKDFEGEVKKDSKIRIEYKFEIPDEEIVDTTKTFTLTIPEQIKIKSEMTLYAKDGERLIATATVTTDNKITIEYEDEVNNEDYLYERTGYFWIYTEFDEEKIGNGGETEIEFDLGGDSSTTIRIEFEEEEEKVDINLQKWGYYNNENNEITWTIKVKPETTPRGKTISNVVITDVIQENQTYIEGSHEISPNANGEFNFENNTLTYTFNEAITDGSEYTIIFKTKPDISAFNKEGERIRFHNQTEATFGDDGTSTSNEATVETIVDFVNKSGRYNATTKQIDWTITINNNNLKIRNAKIVDTFQEGLELDKTSVKIDGSSTNDFIYDDENRILTYIFSEEINEKHTLTYSTNVVDPDAYNSNNPKIYRNKVELGGDGVPGDAIDEEGVGVPTSIIRKEGAGYNASTHEITWRIIVNSNKIKIENAVVTDNIPKGLEYVENSFTVDGMQTNEGFIYTKENDESANRTGSFIYSFGDIDKTTHVLTFKTKVLDNNIWANNKSVWFNNTAKLTGENIKDSISTGNQQVISKVIEKTGIGYDYITRKASWRIVVNQNKMPINNAVVTDIIGDYQNFVVGSVKIDGKEITEGTGDKQYRFDEESRTLTINLGNINDQHTITFETIIPEDKLDIFYENGDKTLLNTATLTGDEIPDGGVSSEGRYRIKNTVVSKTGKYTKGNSFIDWEVVINQNQLPIKNAVLEDTLQEGLELDTSSVKLFKLNIKADGTYDIGDEVALDASTVKYNHETRVFEFVFTEDIKEAYILKFRTDIADTHNNTSFTNTINFKGSSRSETGTSTEIGVSFQTGGGDAGGTGRGSITIVKVDENNNLTKLEGSIFELLDMFKNILKVSEPTGTNGETLFKGLKYDTTYYIREKTPPKGYALSNEIYEFQVKNETGRKDIRYEFKNTKIKGNIEFVKFGEEKEPLAGAEFSLYNAEDDSTSIVTATSGADGKVVFNNIAFGSYIIKETKAPEGYILSDVVLKATISEDGVTVKADPESISNTKIRGSFELTKIDISTSKPLSDAKIAIYTEDDVLVDEKITDENGIAKFENLPYGKYYFIETKAPSGYYRNNEKHSFEIKENGEIVKDTLKNEKMREPKDRDEPSDPKDPDKPTDPKEPSKPTDPKKPEKPQGPEDQDDSIIEITEIETPVDDEVEIDPNEIPLGNVDTEPNVDTKPKGPMDVLPKTGEGSKIGFYISGALLILIGFIFRRKMA